MNKYQKLAEDFIIKNPKLANNEEEGRMFGYAEGFLMRFGKELDSQQNPKEFKCPFDDCRCKDTPPSENMKNCCEKCKASKLIHTCKSDVNGFAACGCCGYQSVCSDLVCPCHEANLPECGCPFDDWCSHGKPEKPSDWEKEWKEIFARLIDPHRNGGIGIEETCNSLLEKLSSLLAEAKKQRDGEILKWAEENNKRHSSIIQLGVCQQGTPEGKLHYQKEYGKRDGYNQALTDIKTFINKEE